MYNISNNNFMYPGEKRTLRGCDARLYLLELTVYLQGEQGTDRYAVYVYNTYI